MKNRIGVVLSILIGLGLVIALVAVRKQASDHQRQDADKIDGLSNRLFKVNDELDRQKQVNAIYEQDLDTHKKALVELTNHLVEVSANLSQTKDSLAKTEALLKTSQDEVAKRDSRISDLEAQNRQLDKQALDLSAAITNLTVQISETQKKLAASEGDKVFLEKELKRLMGEKAELERQFNDLTVLRAQVAKLKEELTIARRIDWIRRGLFASSDQKGAQKLMQGVTAPKMAQAKTPQPAYDLNVEVTADGSVKVIPPAAAQPGATNAPAPR